MNRLVVLIAFLVGLSVPAWATETQSSFKDDAGLSQASRFLVGDITSDAEIPEKADYKTNWLEGLAKRLTDRKILAETSDPAAIAINARITHYEEGNAWARWGTFGAALQTKAHVIATLVRGGQEIGVVEVNQRERGPGLNTIGAWHYIFRQAAETVVFEIEKKMGTDR